MKKLNIAKSTKKFMPVKASSFWMDDDLFDFNYNKAERSKDYVKLAGYQRAIANFVKILTNKNIPVQYADKGHSYTDGENITISARIDEKDFDSTVGLALHEGSHILLSDFEFLKGLQSLVNDAILAYPEHLTWADNHPNGRRWFVYNSVSKIKDLMNVIEDRRIDMYVYRNAPGYQLYYKALYNKYFNSPVIDKGLKSTVFRKEDWESYMFRIINITNPNRDLEALKFLKPIFDIIDLKNIDRLKSTRDVFDVAYKIFWIIEMAVADQQAQSIKLPTNVPTNDSQSNGGGSLTPTPKSGLEEAIESLMDEDMPGNGEDGEDDIEDSAMSGDSASNDIGDMPDNNDDVVMAQPTSTSQTELSSKELHKLLKDIASQEDFIRGEVKKSKLSNTDARIVKAISESDSSLEVSNVDKLDSYGQPIGRMDKFNVLVVKNVTPFVINSGAYSELFISDNSSWNKRHIEDNLKHIQSGLVLGAKLGKKLKIRNEERDTKFTRLKAGVIDKRLISNLGFGAEAVFHKMEQFRYKPMYFHLSIDASGSMNGSQYDECLRLSAAIAKAARMVGNIRVVIDIRSTQGDKPVVAILYDSKRDPLNKLVYNLSHSHASGTTPEALCFDVIMKDIIKGAHGTDAIFFNFSDGEPNFSSGGLHYQGETAFAHTRKQVSRMHKANIQVISYFINSYSSNRATERFKLMYGKDARFIQTNNIVELSRSINERMLKVC